MAAKAKSELMALDQQPIDPQQTGGFVRAAKLQQRLDEIRRVADRFVFAVQCRFGQKAGAAARAAIAEVLRDAGFEDPSDGSKRLNESTVSDDPN
jgi:hypothetical protein